MSQTKKLQQRSSIIFAVTACILWSTAFAGVKIGLNFTTPLQFAGIRFIISGLILLPFCKNLKKEIPIALKNFGQIILLGLFQTTILYFFFYLGLNKTPAAIAAIIVGAGPLFVALLAHFTVENDRLTKRKIIALSIGFSGIVLLALTKDNDTNNYRQVLFGIILLVTGNFAGSYGNILVSKNRIGISPVLLNAIQIFLGGFMLLIISFFSEGFSFGIKPLPYYLSLGWLSILSATAFSLWFTVLRRPGIKVSEINVWKFMIPLLGAILSWLIVPGEKPYWNTLAGMILIALAIVIITRQMKELP
jgi:drug/metabolite transporter (DMT)-like permease